MVFKLPWGELTLTHPETKKTWNIKVNGKVIQSCLNHGKLIEKIEEYTADKAVQQVMAKLRKGFIFYNSHAKLGEAILHTFLNSSYTGFMPIAAREDREDFYALRVLGQFEDEILYHYKEDGTLLSIQYLGAKRLTYSAVLNEDGTLYFNNQHVIEHYDPSINEFISKEGNKVLDMTEEEKNTKVHKLKGIRANYTRLDGISGIEILNIENSKLILSIGDEFIVKNANCAFTANNLIVHSDYGVLSIYNMKI